MKIFYMIISVFLFIPTGWALDTLNGYLPPAYIKGDFQLTGADGQTFFSAQLQGQYSLVLFGYTSCPDVCPTAVYDALRVKKRLAEQNLQIQVIFISVDPERDTPERLKQYLASYGNDLIALTGDLPRIREVADRYRVKFRKKTLEGSKLGYAIDHSAFTYMLDKKGRVLVIYPYGTVTDHLIEDLQLLSTQGQSRLVGKEFKKAGAMEH